MLLVEARDIETMSTSNIDEAGTVGIVWLGEEFGGVVDLCPCHFMRRQALHEIDEAFACTGVVLAVSKEPFSLEICKVGKLIVQRFLVLGLGQEGREIPCGIERGIGTAECAYNQPIEITVSGEE